MGLDWLSRSTSDDGLTLHQSASDAEIEAAEHVLEAEFSADLRSLYRASDGVFDSDGQCFVIWPLNEVVVRNQTEWLDAPADSDRRNLVGFGDDGTGAPFCVPRDGTDAVLIWGPLDQNATWLTGTLREFWTKWTADSLPGY